MNEDVVNRKIEQDIAKHMEEQASVIKLLLLGSGDSGKTTLRKQMRNLYGTGFPKEMREDFAPVILSLLLSGFEEVAQAMDTQLKLPLTDSSKACLKVILVGKQKKLIELDAEVVKACMLFMQDPMVAQAILRRNEYQLQDCWLPFANKLAQFPEWAGPKWLPAVDDCVACRVRTTGIQEEEFKLDNVQFMVVDVGGQRAERRKWINCFDSVTAVIFTAAISEYDQVLFEDRKRNRLEESLDLFEEVCCIKVFQSTDIILFLNKRDLFEKKFAIQGVPLDPIKFPGAPLPHDAKLALAYIEKLFLARNSKKKKIYCHATNAVDSDNIKKVFDACKNIILQASMQATGF
jgi:guanine nucleotide-binding protein G(i) subunit alpha